MAEERNRKIAEINDHVREQLVQQDLIEKVTPPRLAELPVIGSDVVANIVDSSIWKGVKLTAEESAKYQKILQEFHEACQRLLDRYKVKSLRSIGP
jgi:hypothetical protein